MNNLETLETVFKDRYARIRAYTLVTDKLLWTRIEFPPHVPQLPPKDDEVYTNVNVSRNMQNLFVFVQQLAVQIQEYLGAEDVAVIVSTLLSSMIKEMQHKDSFYWAKLQKLVDTLKLQQEAIVQDVKVIREAEENDGTAEATSSNHHTDNDDDNSNKSDQSDDNVDDHKHQVANKRKARLEKRKKREAMERRASQMSLPVATATLGTITSSSSSNQITKQPQQESTSTTTMTPIIEDPPLTLHQLHLMLLDIYFVESCAEQTELIKPDLQRGIEEIIQALTANIPSLLLQPSYWFKNKAQKVIDQSTKLCHALEDLRAYPKPVQEDEEVDNDAETNTTGQTQQRKSVQYDSD